MRPKITVEPLLSPKDNYNLLRNNYLAYNKQIAIDSFNKNIRKGTGAFAKDYLYPAAKTASLINPAVSLAIGVMDSKDAYSKGLTGAAIVGLGLETLPYLKGVKTAAKVLPETVNSINKLIKKKIALDLPAATKMIDKSLGIKVENLLGNTTSIEKVVKDSNKLLSKGLGIKKLNVPIELSYVKKDYNPFNSSEIDVFIGGDKTGRMNIRSIIEPRKLSEIIKKKPLEKLYGFERTPLKEGGYSIQDDFPFGPAPDGSDEVFNPFFDAYNGKGVSGEIKQTLTRVLDKKNLGFYSSTANKNPYSIKEYADLLKKGYVEEYTAPRSDNLPIFPANRLYRFLKTK